MTSNTENSSIERSSQSLTLLDILGYLVGRKASIEKVAADRNCMYYGLLFVVAAGFCREYDQEVLATHWYLYLAPIAMSLVMAGWNFLWFHFYFPKGLRHNSFTTFLALFWMTAPCAWVYALPVEQWVEPITAIQVNMSLLTAVAAWRGWIFCRALGHLTGKSMYAMIVGSATIIVVPLGTFKLLSLTIGLMGGGQFSPEQQAISDFSSRVITVAFWGGIVSLGVFIWQMVRRTVDGWKPLPPGEARRWRWEPLVLTGVICGGLLVLGLPVQEKIETHEEAKRTLLRGTEWQSQVLDDVDATIRSGGTVPWRNLQPRVYSYSMLERALRAYLGLQDTHSEYLHQQVTLWLTHSIEAIWGLQDKDVELVLQLPEDDPLRLFIIETHPQKFELLEAESDAVDP